MKPIKINAGEQKSKTVRIYELKLMSGHVYFVECEMSYIDKLLDLIGDNNYESCEEL